MAAFDEQGSDQQGSDQQGSGEQGSEPRWRRRQRLAAVFGADLHEITGDEREPGDVDRGRGRGWYERNRPPHHG